jgi:catechol 2,3-dioxygenase-like lactoylglutathione lyase family enzyme
MTQGKLDAIGLIVKDLTRSVRFYRGLGAEFPEGAEASEHGHAELNSAAPLDVRLGRTSGEDAVVSHLLHERAVPISTSRVRARGPATGRGDV